MNYRRRSKLVSMPRRLTEWRRQQIADEVAKHMATHLAGNLSVADRTPKRGWLATIGVAFGKAFATTGAVAAALALVLGFEQYRWSREHASRSALADRSTQRQLLEQAMFGQCMEIVDFLYGKPPFSTRLKAEGFVSQLSRYESTCADLGVDLAVARSEFILRQPKLFPQPVRNAAARVRNELRARTRPARVESDLQLSEGFTSLERFIVDANIRQRNFAPATLRYGSADQMVPDGNASALPAEPRSD